MNAAAIQYRHNYEQGGTPMGRPVAASVFLHVCLFAALSFGIPYIVKEPLEMEQAITVDIAELAEISQTDTLAPPENATEKTPPAPAEPKPVYNTAESPPDLLTPQPPDIVEQIPEPPTETVKPEEKPDIKTPPRPCRTGR